MKQRVSLFVTVFLYFILIFIIGKIFFILIHGSANGGVTTPDAINILYNGLPLDLSMSGYLTVLPALFIIMSIWFKPKFIANLLNIYYAVILFLVTAITVSDIVVYPYWGFHFDSTVFLYLQSPKDVAASASLGEMITGFVMTLVFTVILYLGYIYIIRRQLLKFKIPKIIWKSVVVLVVLTGALFLPIRGGVTVSTMNVGKAYFSDNMFFNHAAINPHFNLFYSLFKSNNFGKQYQYYDKQEAGEIFNRLNRAPAATDSITSVLNTDRPNVILFILESFSYDVAMDSTIAPNMARFAKEGILFDNFYANSYRTDRGLVSVLSGYPAHPTVAIMKYPQKTGSLPAIPKTLKQSGYKNMSLYYGGDVDFANMRSYFISSCGITDIVSDKNFPMSDRLTKWGVPDKFVIERCYNDIASNQPQQPFVKVVLTLSSHEPFDVPVDKYDEPFLNAVSYTDACLGDFVDKLKQTPLWNNTLIVLLADHAMQSYPKDVNNTDAARFHIPMIWLGGAVAKTDTVSAYSSQNDLAATLLSQLKINYSDYKFSKDILNEQTRKFAFYSYYNGFSMIDSSGVVTYDNNKKSVIRHEGNPDLEKEAKAFFQNMYIDLGSR